MLLMETVKVLCDVKSVRDSHKEQEGETMSSLHDVSHTKKIASNSSILILYYVIVVLVNISLNP